MPPPKTAAPLRLEFSTNSLRNTTLAAETDTIYYEVVTRFWHPTTTKINRLDTESRELRTIAEIEKSPRKEVKVRFAKGGVGPIVNAKEAATQPDLGEWTRAGDFVKYDEKGVGGRFIGPAGEEYRWKTHKRRLQLVKASDEEKVPLVDFHPHKRHFGVWRMSEHAWLEVKPDALGDGQETGLDRLLVSYLIVERRRRDARLRIKVEHS